MDRKVAADVLDAIADVAPRIPLPMVPHATAAMPIVASLLKALAEHLRNSELETEEIIKRMRRSKSLDPAPWDEKPGTD